MSVKLKKTPLLGKRSVLFLIPAALVIIAIVIMLNWPIYLVNDNGQTYGSQIVSDYDKQPDLIAVGASNGRFGYYYKSQYRALMEKHMALGFEEASQIYKRRFAVIAANFKEAAKTYYGFDLFPLGFLESSFKEPGNPEGDVEVCRMLNTYLVEAVASNKAADGSAIAENSEGEAPMRAVYLHTQTFADQNDNPFEPLSLADGRVAEFMSFDLYLKLYSSSKGGVGVPISVYEKDGQTVIGEFYLDVLIP